MLFLILQLRNNLLIFPTLLSKNRIKADSLHRYCTFLLGLFVNRIIPKYQYHCRNVSVYNVRYESHNDVLPHVTKDIHKNDNTNLYANHQHSFLAKVARKIFLVFLQGFLHRPIPRKLEHNQYFAPIGQSFLVFH